MIHTFNIILWCISSFLHSWGWISSIDIAKPCWSLPPSIRGHPMDASCWLLLGTRMEFSISSFSQPYVGLDPHGSRWFWTGSPSSCWAFLWYVVTFGLSSCWTFLWYVVTFCFSSLLWCWWLPGPCQLLQSFSCLTSCRSLAPLGFIFASLCRHGLSWPWHFPLDCPEP